MRWYLGELGPLLSILKMMLLEGVIAVKILNGNPFCITVDHQTKEDQTLTIRY
jgi:hypothetical protein